AATRRRPPSARGAGPPEAGLRQPTRALAPQRPAPLMGKRGPPPRFPDARALVAYVGFSPVISESGARAAPPRLSRIGPRLARHSLYLAAFTAVRHSAEWRTIYLRKKAQGKTPNPALVAVACKLRLAPYATIKH